MIKLSVKTNYFYNLIYQIITIIIPFITTPYISRILEADGVGAYSYSYTVASYFVLFGVLGTNVYGQQIIAENQDNVEKKSQYFWEINIIRFVCTMVSLIVYLTFAFSSQEYRLLLIILSLTVFSNIFDISWYFQGLENFKIVAVRNVIIKIVTVLGIFTFIKSKNDLPIYVACIALSSLIGNLSLWVHIRSVVKKPHIELCSLVIHLKKTVVYFIPQVAYHIYGAVDKLMIGLITKSNFENGYYEQAHKIINMIITIVTSLNIVMRSKISYLLGKKRNDDVQKNILFSYKYLCFLSFPIIIGQVCCIQEFVPLFFGEGYNSVKIILVVFSPIVFATGLNSLLGIQYLTPIGKQGKCNIVLIVAAGFNIMLNALLIPLFQSMGATVASIFAETLVAVVYCIMSKEILPYKTIFKYAFYYLLPALGMGLCILLCNIASFDNIALTLGIKVITGVVTYLGILLLMKDELTIAGVQSIGKKFKR